MMRLVLLTTWIHYFCSIHKVNSFQTFQLLQKEKNKCKLYGKSPRSLFDLEAIEKYERSILTTVPIDNDDLLDEEVDSYNEKESYIYHCIPESLNNKRMDAAIAALEPKLSRHLLIISLTFICSFLNQVIYILNH